MCTCAQERGRHAAVTESPPQGTPGGIQTQQTQLSLGIKACYTQEDLMTCSTVYHVSETSDPEALGTEPKLSP